MQYSSDELIKPFWAENSGFTTGRDPLGVQNSSIITYSRLLPGMTNLTQRIRYYGFYCWLLKVYPNLKIEENLKTVDHHYNFIRRAELLLAFMMVNYDPNQKGIIGSNHANSHLNDEIYNLKNGAVKDNNKTEQDVYWDFPSGALGQYYAGSLFSLGLIKLSDNFFIITPKGIEIAIAFENGINNLDACNEYIELISKDLITRQDLEKIQTFAPNLIQYNTPEWNKYIELLLNPDGIQLNTNDGNISLKRKETIDLYLKYIDDNNKKIKFEKWVFNLDNEEIYENSAQFGWLYYYLNETFHFALESIFWAMLVQLEGKLQHVNDFTIWVENTISSSLSIKYNVETSLNLETIIKIPNKEEVTNKIDELHEIVKYPLRHEEVLFLSTDLLLTLYAFSTFFEEKVKAFENLNYLGSHPGNISEILSFIQVNMQNSIKFFAKNLARKIINMHISTAYRKMGNGESNLLKFIIEENIIGHIQTLSPKNTNPRTNTLNFILNDLKLVDENSNLTEQGIELQLLLMN